MFEIESKKPDVVTIITKKTAVTFDVAEGKVSANLEVGDLCGPGEFEIGDVSIRGIKTASGKVVYDAEVANVHVGIIGGNEENLDDIVANVLCTSSVRAVREIDPRVVVAMGNVDSMVAELKVPARTEKRLKVKSLDALPATLDVVALI